MLIALFFYISWLLQPKMLILHGLSEIGKRNWQLSEIWMISIIGN